MAMMFLKINLFFYSMDKPCIAKRSGNCSFIYFGSAVDHNGKVWLNGEESKSSIKNGLCSLKWLSQLTLRGCLSIVLNGLGIYEIPLHKSKNLVQNLIICRQIH